MNKLLLTPLVAVSFISAVQASAVPVEEGTAVAEKIIDGLTISDPIRVYPGNNLSLENANEYLISTTVGIMGNNEYGSTLLATKPVTISGSDAILRMMGDSIANFNDTLTIENGRLQLSTSGEKVPSVNVKGMLVYEGSVNAWGTEGTEISIQKKEGEERALFDISKLTGGYSPAIVNGNNETFLEYYNAESDLAETGYTAEQVPSLDSLKDLPVGDDPDNSPKYNFAANLRSKITNYVNNVNYAVLKNMKIQDYLVKGGDGGVVVYDTNKVKCELGDMETLISSDETAKNAVKDKEGLSLVAVDGTGAFDFYNKFNEENYDIEVMDPDGFPIVQQVYANERSNTFVQWPDSYQLPLSNETSNNTEFDFKVDLAPSGSANDHDIYLTSGVQDVETVKFSGNNSYFGNKAILNGKLKNVEFASKNGYVAIDATNIAEDLSLSIADGTEGNQGINNIKVAPVVSEGQKITFSTGNYNIINFTSADGTEKVYNFDTFNMGTGSLINVGDNGNQNVTLVL